MRAQGWFAFLITLSAAACGGGSTAGDVDASGDDVFMSCGNLMIEGTETCDDGNDDPDDGCSSSCQLECGDGEVTGTETCDSAIADGDPGACPTDLTCTDDDACTTAIVSGGDCMVTCEFAVNTVAMDGDGCCPTGADATTDDDCTAVCGNSVVETPEACDTGIASGFVGACPEACNDGQNCTTDALINGGTCDAACTTTAITAIGPADTCCPSGGMPGNDPDCVGCGDGDVTGTETCDTAIASGTGSCPVACNDGNACTVDTLVNAGTCSAACSTSPTAPGPMDGCCPLGATLATDPDCPAACGDNIITPPETCDGGNATGGDGCSSTCRIEPIAYRISDLDLKDPHVFANAFGCLDVTNIDLGTIKGVNPLLQINIQTDDDGDGVLDLSITNTFNPLNQVATMTSPSDLTFPDCLPPYTGAACSLPMGAAHIPATATNKAALMTCLAPVAATTSGYSPAVVSSIAPTGGTCYSADAGTVTFSLGGIPITLTGAKIGGEWFGTPATEIRDGLISGFMSETQANATIIPAGTTGQSSIDGHSLGSLLRGGVGSCSQPSPMVGDTEMVGGVRGWMFYLNFTALKATSYTEL